MKHSNRLWGTLFSWTLCSAVTIGCGGPPDVDAKGISGGTMPNTVNCTKNPGEAKIEHTIKPDPATCVKNPPETVPALTAAAVSVGPQAALIGSLNYFFVSWSLCSYNLTNTSTNSFSYNLVAIKTSRIADNPACVTAPGTPIPQSCFASPDQSVSFTASALDGCTCQSEMVFVNTPTDQEDDISNAAACPATRRVTWDSGEYYVTLTAPFVNTLPVQVFVP